MRRAPRPYLQLARPSVELQVTRRGASLDDVLAVVGVRGDREDERRGVIWVLREDPLPGENLAAASRRLLDRAVPLRGALSDLAARGFTVRVLFQQAPGEGHVVPAGWFQAAAAWGGRIDVDQFVVVDCGDLEPTDPGIFLDPAGVVAHAATGTDLLVGGFGTAEPRTDPGWVLPWRGRTVREATYVDGSLHVRLDDRSVLDCHIPAEALDVAEITEVGPRELPPGAVRRLQALQSAVVWSDGLRLVGDGVRVQGRVRDLVVQGRGFRCAGAAPEFHDAVPVVEGFVEHDGLNVLWYPSSEADRGNLAVDLDVTDLVVGVSRSGPGDTGPAVRRTTGVLLEALRRSGRAVSAWRVQRPGAVRPDLVEPVEPVELAALDELGAGVLLAVGDPSAVVRRRPTTWSEFLDGVVGVLLPEGDFDDTEPGIRFTTRSELVGELVEHLRGQ